MIRKGFLALAGAAAALGMAVGPAVVQVDTPPPAPPKVKRRHKPRSAKAWYAGSGGFGRSRYIPAGPHRNCGDRGISPKKVKS